MNVRSCEFKASAGRARARGLTLIEMITTMAISTIVLLPEDVSAPLTQLIVPAFLRADLAQNRQSFLQYGTANPAQGLLGAWNVGQLLGLPGLASLLPLALVWAVAFGLWTLHSRTRRRFS